MNIVFPYVLFYYYNRLKYILAGVFYLLRRSFFWPELRSKTPFSELLPCVCDSHIFIRVDSSSRLYSANNHLHLLGILFYPIIIDSYNEINRFFLEGRLAPP